MPLSRTAQWTYRQLLGSKLIWSDIRAASSQASVDTTSSFRAQDVLIEESPIRKPKPEVSKLVFGHHFTDHMLEIPWSEQKGWGKPVISPLHHLQVHPAAKVLHYAIELFEGMKAYMGVDGKVRLFRPDENAKRMISTAKRSALPEFDGNELVKLIAQLVDIDRSWVPSAPNSSLYLRPTFIGTEPTLGVARSKEALLYVIMGPTGPYFAGGLKPVSLLADPRFVRSWHGGAGSYKMGSNYGPTVAIQKEAEKIGCQQVLWLYGEKHLLTEVGTMNIFVYWRNEQNELELTTPPLDGLILPGVTRKSIIELARQWGKVKVTERPISMEEVVQANEDKRLIEIFGAGTGCIVCPVSRIHYGQKDIHMPAVENSGLFSQKVYHELQDIQYGRIPNHPWTVEIDAILGDAESHSCKQPRMKAAKQ